MVAIGLVRERIGDERLPRDSPEGIEDFRLGNASAAELAIDHRGALGGIILRENAHAPKTREGAVALLNQSRERAEFSIRSDRQADCWDRHSAASASARRDRPAAPPQP